MTVTVRETEEILYAGTVENIAALITQGGFPPDAFFLAECLPRQAITERQRQVRQDLLCFARVGELGPHLSEQGHAIDPALYTSGRIFAQDFELRWYEDQQSGQTQVVYLGATRALPGLTPASDLEERRVELKQLKKGPAPRLYYLFGEVLGGDRLKQMGLEKGQGYYAEVRIHRLLRYPTLPGPARSRRIQLAVCEYIEEETGSVKMFRFQDLKEAE